MAVEKKEHKIVSADNGAEMNKDEAKKSLGTAKKQAAPVGNSTGLRIGAIVLWVLAIGFELCAIFVAVGKMDLKFMPTLWQMIAFIVLDLAAVIVGSQLWKKANHISPASEKNKVKFWLWNNLGLVVTVLAFVPFIILLLTNKNADKKTKAVAAVVAVIALLIAGVSSYDFNPVSQEQKEAAMAAITGDVLWTNTLGGKVYHTHEDCQSLNRTEELVQGTVEQAIAAGRTRLCYYCAKKDNLENTVATDNTAGAVEEAVEAVAETLTEEPAEETPAEEEPAA